MNGTFPVMAKKKKNAHAQAMVKQRNRKLSPARRSEIASNAARVRHARQRAATEAAGETNE
jgi:hypothetical protein